MHIKILTRFKLPLVAIALVLLSVHAATAGDNIWTTSGPYGAPIHVIAIDPEDNQVIYAAFDTGVYESADGGTTWLSSGSGLPDSANIGWTDSLAFDPHDSVILYLATERGVYKSTDSAETWALLSAAQARSIATSPVDRDLIFVGGYESPTGGGGGIYRSKDRGETWELLQNGAPTGSVLYLMLAPSAAHVIYAGGMDIGIYKSIDGGDSWLPAHSAFVGTPSLLSMAVDPYDSQVVYISVSGQGLYRSANGGDNWQPIGTGLDIDVRAIAIDPGNQQVIYAGGGADLGSPGVYRSLDNHGLTWAPIKYGMGSRTVWGLTLDHNAPQTIFAGTAAGIWEYTLIAGPADYSLSINDAALYTNQTAVTLTITAPAGTTEMIISNDGGFGDAAWEPLAAQKPWSLSAYGDHAIPRSVYAKFRTGGQISGLYQDDIVLDVNAPTGSVQITATHSCSGMPGFPPPESVRSSLIDALTTTVHLPLVLRNARPGSTMIALVLSATDDLSGVGEMLISNHASFSDVQWEEFSTERSWWVPDRGTTTVYVKYRDRAGNESAVCSDTVTP